MLKNISFLALAGALAFAPTLTGCVVVTDDGSTVGETGTGDGDGDTGDGDGDDATTGDGDGDGDGGDGDGDGGDGDGDAGDGDGDGDAGSCGWLDPAPDPAGYYCGGSGEDPSGTNPSACPDGLVEGEACGEVTGIGCCDANGDNWYCGDDGMGSTFLVLEACGG